MKAGFQQFFLAGQKRAIPGGQDRPDSKLEHRNRVILPAREATSNKDR